MPEIEISLAACFPTCMLYVWRLVKTMEAKQ